MLCNSAAPGRRTSFLIGRFLRSGYISVNEFLNQWNRQRPQVSDFTPSLLIFRAPLSHLVPSQVWFSVLIPSKREYGFVRLMEPSRRWLVLLAWWFWFANGRTDGIIAATYFLRTDNQMYRHRTYLNHSQKGIPWAQERDSRMLRVRISPLWFRKVLC